MSAQELPAKYYERFGFRSRRVVFRPKDELAYGALLRAAFPRCIFMDQDREATTADDDPPILRRASIAECLTNRVAFFLDENEFVPEQMLSHGRWFIDSPTRPFGTWVRNTDPQNYYSGRPSPPQLRCSEIDFLIRPDDKAGIAQAEKALRLLGKVASRKTVRQLQYPSRQPWPSEMANPLVGHHALEWVRSSPDYWIELGIPAVSVHGPGWGAGYRPVDDES